MKLYLFNQRVLAGFKGTLEILDEQGNTRYTLMSETGSMLLLHLLDLQGEEVATITQKRFCLEPTFFVKTDGKPMPVSLGITLKGFMIRDLKNGWKQRGGFEQVDYSFTSAKKELVHVRMTQFQYAKMTKADEIRREMMKRIGQPMIENHCYEIDILDEENEIMLLSCVIAAECTYLIQTERANSYDPNVILPT